MAVVVRLGKVLAARVARNVWVLELVELGLGSPAASGALAFGEARACWRPSVGKGSVDGVLSHWVWGGGVWVAGRGVVWGAGDWCRLGGV